MPSVFFFGYQYFTYNLRTVWSWKVLTLSSQDATWVFRFPWMDLVNLWMQCHQQFCWAPCRSYFVNIKMNYKKSESGIYHSLNSEIPPPWPWCPCFWPQWVDHFLLFILCFKTIGSVASARYGEDSGRPCPYLWSRLTLRAAPESHFPDDFITVFVVATSTSPGLQD